MILLTIVAFRWGVQYTSAHVNVHRRMVARNLSLPHRYVCATDDPAGLDNDIAVVRLDPRLVKAGRRYPKLAVYRKDAAEIFGGKRIVSIDLDCVVTGSLDPLFDRSESIVVWKNPGWGSTPYNTSLVMLDAGHCPEVYDRFGTSSNDAVRASRFMGSDQAWLAVVMGRGLPNWKRSDGVFSYMVDCRRDTSHRAARIVFFPGEPKPWHPDVLKQLEWVREAWR